MDFSEKSQRMYSSRIVGLVQLLSHKLNTHGCCECDVMDGQHGHTIGRFFAISALTPGAALARTRPKVRDSRVAQRQRPSKAARKGTGGEGWDRPGGARLPR